MFVDWQGLGEEVSDVVRTFYPFDGELALLNSVANPVKTHIDGFGLVSFGGAIGDADGTGVVAEYDGGWLRKSEGGGNDTKVRDVLTADE